MNVRPSLMKPYRLLTFSLVLALILPLGLVSASAAPDRASFIVRGVSVEAVTSLVEAYGGEVTSHLALIDAVGATLPLQAVHSLRTNPKVVSVVPNGEVLLAGKKDKGAPETDYPEVVGADVTWDRGVNGGGVTVAVVDTGLADLPGISQGLDESAGNRIVGWVDFVDGRKKPHDPNGHGTHIAGIIANSDLGTDGEWNGVAPGVNLAGVRVLNDQGYGTYETVIQGVQWVVNHEDELGIKVLNLSLVASVESPYWADPLNLAVTRAWAEGITVVVAAGNGGPDPMTVGVPGNNPYVITVGAFTDNYTPADWSDDYIAPFSAAGPTLDGFAKPDVVAPGAHIVSTMKNGTFNAKKYRDNQVGKNYYWLAGTSQAAAVVSGVAALTLSHTPDLSPDQVKYRVQSTAFPWVDLESTEALYSMFQQGAGRVNAPDSVFSEATGSANQGLDIWADLSGDRHFEGYAYYDEASEEFRLRGDFSDWAGGYGSWAGGYGAWAGGYGAWAGGYGAWAGGYGAWAGGYGAWAGGYGAWAGGYGAWAGGYGAWVGGYGAWAGGYGAWAGGYGAWAGSYGSAEFAETFVNWKAHNKAWKDTLLWTGELADFDG